MPLVNNSEKVKNNISEFIYTCPILPDLQKFADGHPQNNQAKLFWQKSSKKNS
jgi:hypothetical protein